MFKRRNLLSGLFGILILVTTSKTYIYAQESRTTLSVSPAIIEMYADPETSKEVTITLFNKQSTAIPVTATIGEFTPNAGEQASYQRPDWIEVQPSEFILQPASTKQVTVRVNVPKDASPGGHYATIYFQPQQVREEGLTQETSYINARIGVLALITISGDVIENSSVNRFKTNSFTANGPYEFSFEVHNTGNVHSIPKGTFYVKNLLGHSLYNKQVTPNLILPNSSKVITIPLENVKLIPGIYTAELNVFFTNTQELVVKKQFVIVAPILQYYLIRFLLTVLIYSLIIKRRNIFLAAQILFGKAK